MKKTRKALSLVLSFLIAFASMPMVYTATVASDVSAYALREEGTIDNPTLPVSESGEYSQTEKDNLSFSQKSLKFAFYQTRDDQYFTFDQNVAAEKFCGLSNAGREVKLNLTFGLDLTDAATSSFVNNNAGTINWVGNNEESASSAFPGAISMDGSYWGGCTDYNWTSTVMFKGAPAGKTGEQNYSYTQLLDYKVTIGSESSYTIPVTTTIEVVDCRELIEKMAEAEEIIANADNYKDEYISAVQAALNSVPDYLKDFSEYYSQDVVDRCVYNFNNISKNSADYRAYNKTYSSLKSITNERDAFDANSFVAFQEEIFTIDANLPKTLEKTEQATVDAATQALRDAYAKLVHKDVGREDESYYWDSLGHAEFGNTDISIDNQSFKFMQISDNQQFSFTQTWSIARSAKEDGGDTAPIFHGIVLDPTTTSTSSSCTADNCKNKNTVGATNGTTTFLNSVSADSKNPITYSTEENTTIQTHEFTKWEYLGSYNEDNEKSMSGAADIVNASTGKLVANAQNTDDREFKITEKTTFKLKVSPTFTGLSASESGEKKLDFVQRLGITFKTGAVVGAFGTSHKKHMHHASSIVITDVRTLLSTMATAEKELSNPDHSEAYKVALQAALDSAPMEMTYGVKYYTQEQVDSIVNNILNVKEDCADYSEFNELYNKLKALENNGRYTDESFEAFNDTIEEINFNLDKGLDASQQSIIDEATQALKQAYINLEYFAVDGDTTFSDTDCPELEETYNTLSFDISKTEYNFMQNLDGQELAIKTDVHFTNTSSRYKTFLHDIEYSQVVAGDDTCATRENPDDGCHYLENIKDEHNSANFLDSVISGVEFYDASSEEVNDIGVLAQNTGWVVDEHRSAGTGFVSDGKIVDAYEIGTGDYYASSEIVCRFLTGGVNIDEAAKQTKSYTDGYSWRFGWQYRENVWTSKITNRHVHIPVNINVTDARALTKLYYIVEDIINNHSKYSYTMATLADLYYVWSKIPVDMVEGSTYYTQDVVNEKYAALYDSYTELNVGANYNEYFDASIKAQEIISSGNRDEYGNPLYTPEFFEEFVKNATEIDSNLDKNLPADADGENQKTIDAATDALLNEISKLENEKRADYTALEEALIKANNLKNAEGVTYTDSTFEVLKEAIKAAEELDRNLLAKDQATVDAITSQLLDAIDTLEYKADYSEFEEAYKRVEDIVNNPDQYDSKTVEAAKKALEEADKLDRDLADTNKNRQTIADATDALNAFLDSVDKKADYTTYNTYLDICNNVDKSKYTEESYNAFMEIVNRVDANLPKDLPASQQSTITAAEQELYNAYMDLLSSVSNADSTGGAFTQDDVAGEYSGAFKFSVAAKDYYVTQTVNDEKIKVVTDLVVSNGDAANTTITLDSLKINAHTASDAAAKCSATCLNQGEVPTSYADNIFCLPNIQHGVITGVAPMLGDNGEQIADTNGDMAWFTTWQNVSGTPLSSDGVLISSTAIAEESSASAHYVFASAGGGDVETKQRDHTYVIRLGWTENDVAYHAHIPVTLHISDARSLRTNYYAYTDFINAGGDGTYTQESLDAAADILATVNTDIVNGNGYFTQEQIDAENAKLEQALNTIEKKADYSGLDDAYDLVKEIVNAPDGTYTDETVKKAQDAIDAADALNKDLPATEQQTVTDVINGLKDAYENAEKKADYTEFDKAKDALEEIVNNPDKYTDETVKNAQDALEEANKIDPDLPKDEEGVNQGIIDDATQKMEDALKDVQEKADYSDYNDAKAEADSLVNDDGNGNPIYDEDAFNEYKEAVENVDKGLDKNLPKDDEGKNQDIIDKATQDLTDLKAELEEKKIYTVTFIGLDGETLSVVEYVNGSAFGTINAPALPEATDTIVYAGWLNGAEFMVAESVLTGNVTLTIASEFSKIVPKSESTVVVDKVTGYVTGVNKDTTVAQLKAELQNDAETITIVDFNGNVLADDALVGTGAVVSVNSKYTTAVYESKTVIIYGDLDGDGDVDADDFAKAKQANVADETFYSEEEKAFFLANDVNGDGAIDVLDSWTIGRIRNGFATVI